MREFDEAGLWLAKAQGSIFEESLERYSGSSPIFIRNYMYAEETFNVDRFDEFDSAKIIFELNKKRLDIGKIKYSNDVIYWIGYIYRYWVYVYETNSIRIYKIANADEMSKYYRAYHTMDPKFAIDRILEDKNINEPMTYERQLELFKKSRNMK